VGYDNSFWHLHPRHTILLNYAKSFLAPGTGERIEVRGGVCYGLCSPLILTFSPQGEKELIIQQPWPPLFLQKVEVVKLIK
jgi:hypothetical protein